MSVVAHLDSRPGFAVLVDRARAGDPQFATDFVNAALRAARDAGASDVHLDPAADTLAVRWRLDGVLQPLCDVPKEVGPNIIARLKVLAGLLTYEMALPQEGRIWDEALRVEVRVSTFPALYGERAVLRLLGASNSAFDSLSKLGLPAEVLEELERHLAATSGAILIVGPAGSGKTTTAYACLRQVVAESGGGRSIASLEDPVEVAVEGVAQSQVNLAAEFDMATGLRSLLRLDPEVILIGEMRDRATAEIALQAALTGQLVVTTFHAGNCGDAIKRLVEIGIPSYAVRNAVRLVVAQRLVRRLCNCAQNGDVEKDARALGLDVGRCWVAGGCEACRATGYRGRALVAEWRTIGDISSAEPVANDERLWASAAALIEAGITSPQEVIRVLGLRRRT
ncbi:MAG TPA: GspE/PulE family protein [Lacipirellulaceae bacterium]|nr:GspE/PulE family protein [Lacipirellulaceae bacterium]